MGRRSRRLIDACPGSPACEIALLTLARLPCERLNIPLSRNNVESIMKRPGIGE